MQVMVFFLEVMSNGSKRWRYRYSHGGKRKLLSMGIFPAISLHDAKSLRDKANVLVAQGVDPSEVRQDQKSASKLSAINTFEAIANEWLDRPYVQTRNHADCSPYIDGNRH